MYNNKAIKLIITILVIFVTLLNFSIMVYGVGVEDNPGKYKPARPNDDTIGETDLRTRANTILGVVNVVGVFVSVATLIIIGIKYMIGSVEEKAEYKKTMITYLIGALLVFAVTTIPNILYKLGTSINK